MAAVAARRRGSWSGAIIGLGLLLVAVYVGALLLLMESSSWDTWGAMFVGPLLFAASLPAFARQARREGVPKVFWFLVAALAAKMLFSLFRYYHAFHVVERADAQAYDQEATTIALRFLDGNFETGLNSLLDSNFIRFFTGVIYTVTRPSVVAGFLLYAWLAFWGTYFFYRAFVLAVPQGNRWSYARWLFLMPSMLFWPSSIGKEAWLIFGLGIAAFGAAKTLNERALPGLVVSGIGIGLAALVRAPIGVLMGIGLVVGGILRGTSRQPGHRGPIGKLVSLAVFAVLAVVLAGVLQGYIARNTARDTRADSQGGLGGLVQQSLEQTSQGGTEFDPVRIDTPAGIVLAPVTVLFRPFIHEVPLGPEGVVTVAESTLLLAWSVIRCRSFLSAVRHVRRIPYVAVAGVYVAGSIVALSAVANFGIIVRQRTLVLPMYLVFMCFLPGRREKRPDPDLTPVALATAGRP